MKPEINDEFRLKVFGMYLNQRVLFNPDFGVVMMLNCTTLADFHEKDILILRRISSITDEDAIEILKIFGKYNDSADYKFLTKTNTFNETFRQVYTINENKYGMDINPVSVHANFTDRGFHSLHSNRDETYWIALDYLRYKGYATPYMSYSVEELTAAGIYKIVDQLKERQVKNAKP